MQHGADPGGEVGRQRLARPGIGGDHRFAGPALGTLDRRFADADVAQQAGGEHERVARRHHGHKAFFDFA